MPRGAGRSVARDVRVRLTSTRKAFGHRDLSLLLVVWGVWVTTDWALLITVSLLALDLQGAAAVGIVGAVRVLPAAVLTGPLSVLTDRYSRSALLAGVYAGWALIAVLLAWCALVEAPFGVLLLVVGIGAALGSVVKPTLQAIMPTLVQTPAQLVTANSAYATIEGLGTVLGPAICAAAFTWLQPQGVFLVVAVLFGVGALAAAGVRTPYQPVSSQGHRHDLLAPLRGFGVLFGRDVRAASGLIMAQTLMRGLLTVFVVLVAASLPLDGEALTGSAFVAMGIGGLIGAVLAARMAGAGQGTLWMAVGITMWGVPTAVLGLWPAATTALAMLAVIGLGNALLDVFGYSLLNRMFPDHLAGRAWGAFHAGGAATVALGSLLAPALASLLGLTGAMVLTGLVLAALPWVSWRWFSRVDARASGRSEDLGLLRAVPMLEPMSTIGLERLARRATVVDVAAGDTVMSEGQPADSFYVVVTGSLTVSRGDEVVRTLGDGACFGEIGLLERSPRTATVVAGSPTRLLRLEGDDFVVAVTGHRPSDEAVRGAVASYRRQDERRTAHDA